MKQAIFQRMAAILIELGKVRISSLAMAGYLNITGKSMSGIRSVCKSPVLNADERKYPVRFVELEVDRLETVKDKEKRLRNEKNNQNKRRKNNDTTYSSIILGNAADDNDEEEDDDDDTLATNTNGVTKRLWFVELRDKQQLLRSPAANNSGINNFNNNSSSSSSSSSSDDHIKTFTTTTNNEDYNDEDDDMYNCNDTLTCRNLQFYQNVGALLASNSTGTGLGSNDLTRCLSVDKKKVSRVVFELTTVLGYPCHKMQMGRNQVFKVLPKVNNSCVSHENSHLQISEAPTPSLTSMGLALSSQQPPPMTMETNVYDEEDDEEDEQRQQSQVNHELQTEDATSINTTKPRPRHKVMSSVPSVNIHTDMKVRRQATILQVLQQSQGVLSSSALLASLRSLERLQSVPFVVDRKTFRRLLAQMSTSSNSNNSSSVSCITAALPRGLTINGANVIDVVVLNDADETVRNQTIQQYVDSLTDMAEKIEKNKTTKQGMSASSSNNNKNRVKRVQFTGDNDKDTRRGKTKKNKHKKNKKLKKKSKLHRHQHHNGEGDNGIGNDNDDDETEFNKLEKIRKTLLYDEDNESDSDSDDDDRSSNNSDDDRNDEDSDYDSDEDEDEDEQSLAINMCSHITRKHIMSTTSDDHHDIMLTSVFDRYGMIIADSNINSGNSDVNHAYEYEYGAEDSSSFQEQQETKVVVDDDDERNTGGEEHNQQQQQQQSETMSVQVPLPINPTMGIYTDTDTARMYDDDDTNASMIYTQSAESEGLVMDADAEAAAMRTSNSDSNDSNANDFVRYAENLSSAQIALLIENFLADCLVRRANSLSPKLAKLFSYALKNTANIFTTVPSSSSSSSMDTSPLKFSDLYHPSYSLMHQHPLYHIDVAAIKLRLPLQISKLMTPFTGGKLRKHLQQLLVSTHLSVHGMIARVVSEPAPIRHPLLKSSFFVDMLNSVLDDEVYKHKFMRLNPPTLTSQAFLEEAAWSRALQVRVALYVDIIS